MVFTLKNRIIMCGGILTLIPSSPGVEARLSLTTSPRLRTDLGIQQTLYFQPSEGSFDGLRYGGTL